MTRNKLLARLQEIKIIRKEKVILRSGEISDFYCDIKGAFGYPDILNALADEIGKELPETVTCIASSGYGGLPIGSVVASRFNKKFIAVRSSEKDHGKKGLLNGYIPNKNDVIVIIDDVLTSGSSIKETLSALKNSAKELRSIPTIHSAIVIVKRGDPKLPIPYSYVFTIGEIVGKK